MIKKALLLFYVLISTIICAQPTLTKDWDYKEPIARGSFVSHDSAGNIITIGLGGTNMFGTYVRLIVIKQDTAGNLIWKKVLGDVAGGLLRAKDFVIDSANNIYITGRAHYNAQNAEGFTLKYDAAGNLVWRKYYGSAIGLVGELNSITLYDNKYVYVTGEMDSINGQGARKAILAKYDSIGNLLWNKSDSVGYNQEGKSVEVDKADNAYLIGYTSCCLPGGKMFVEKYDSTGTKKWKTVIIDTAYQYGYPYCSIIDDSSNVYLGGEIQGLHVSTGFDAGYSKLDSSGNIVWFTSFVSDTSSQVVESPFELKLDNAFSCYSKGYSINNNSNVGFGFFLKLDSKGSEKWVHYGNSIFTNRAYNIRGIELINESTFAIGGFGLSTGNYGELFVMNVDTSGNVISKLNFTVPQNTSISNNFSAFDSSYYFTGAIWDSNFMVPDSMFTLKLKHNNITNTQSYIQENIEVTVFPIPFTNEMNLRIKSSSNLSNFQLNVYNPDGIKLYSRSLPPFKSQFLVDLQSIPTGIYFIELTSNSLVISRTKAIKM